MHTCSGVANEGVEDACHNREAFTATVVKVSGTSGDGGMNATLMARGLLCIHVVFWSFYAFPPPIHMCMLAEAGLEFWRMLFISVLPLSSSSSPSPSSVTHKPINFFLGDFLSLYKALKYRYVYWLIFLHTRIFICFRLSLYNVYTHMQLILSMWEAHNVSTCQ